MAEASDASLATCSQLQPLATALTCLDRELFAMEDLAAALAMSEPAELPAVVAARRLHQTPAAELKEANTLQVLSTLLQNLALRPKNSPFTSYTYMIYANI